MLRRRERVSTKAHSCVAISGLRERQARPIGFRAARRNAIISDSHHSASPPLTKMAAGRGNMEIMDSEDEPLTSSPVNVSDASADKPSAATSVQSHDAQDARQVDAHQTSAEHSTNITEERINGMDVDQEDVPVDVQLSQIDSTNVQPSTIPDMTSQPLPDTVNVTVERTGPADFKMADAQGTDYQAHTETDSGPISEHPVCAKVSTVSFMCLQTL
jgi:hypothetical protein